MKVLKPREAMRGQEKNVFFLFLIVCLFFFFAFSSFLFISLIKQCRRGQTEILDLLRVSGSNWKRMQILESKGVNQSDDESLFDFPVRVQKVTLRTWHNRS